MKRIISIIILAVTIFIIMNPTISTADFYVVAVKKSPMAGPKKSLCEFPFGLYGNFEVKYDHWVKDSNYTLGQYPKGGIKISLWLGYFATAQQRDELTNRIRKVMFYNKDTGEYYELTQAWKYLLVTSPSGEYSMWLGAARHILGSWEIIVDLSGDKYSASYTLTQEMLDETQPLPVDPLVSFDGTIFTVSAPITNGDYYRLRVWDSNDDLVVNENMGINGNIASAIVPSQYAGYDATIQTRFSSGSHWVALMVEGSPETCNSNGCVVGAGSARTAVYFRIEEIQ